ncbi:polynucleotide 5'-hydroxyl-kinase NOL9 isoform X1 [Pogonomyrmex barbatus]|uniref:Polynucleotide 5'-hydroxyl-kinase NOL9 n=2 Tax=Pogonomyrmex barbatus TaxID=144034 RepID=A0A6I9VUL6_9HYME|nr:polynucleotide 5'-hydroxyl-kinase NOL9 isoform X1 [Pogonomyrmex barbatus]
MKVKHNKTKEENPRYIPLDIRKVKIRKIQKKTIKPACKDTTMNLVNDTCAKNIENISSSSNPVFKESISKEKIAIQQVNLKHKKEYSDKEIDSETFYLKKINDSIKCTLDQQMETQIGDSWKLIPEEEIQDDDWRQVIVKEQKHLDTPIEISDSDSLVNFPQIVEDNQKTGLDKNHKTTCDDILTLNISSEVSCTSSNAVKNDKNKDVSDTSKNIDNESNPVENLTYREFVEDKNSGSINYDNDLEACSGSEQSLNLPRRLRNRKPPKVYCIKKMVVIIMERGSRFNFIGKLLIKVLYGSVKIYGFIMNKLTKATKVYSPRGYSNIVIETNKELLEDSIDDVWKALAAKGINRDFENQLQIDIDNIRPGMAVLILQNFENTLTHFLETYFPFKLFPKMKNSYSYSWTDPKRAATILQANLYLNQYDNFNNKLIVDSCITLDVTEKMLDCWFKNEWCCALIAGGKNVGKSTTVRCLINSLLRTSKKVVLVDIDPGQSECTPSSCISYSLIEEPLMGPNFTHLKVPVYQLFIDDVSVSRCVTRYLEGVKMLIEKLKECPLLSLLPIVVNTMGFTKGLGWNIAMFTIKLIRPSIIVQIVSSKKKNNFDDVLSAKVVNKQECSWTFCDEKFINWNKPCEHDLFIMYSQAETATQKKKWNMEPYQQRELVMMSYLSGIVYNKTDSDQYNSEISLNISEVIPYMMPFSSLCIIPQRLFGVPTSHALSVINANIVALCGIDLTEKASREYTDISNLRILTQRSPLCTCYGFGIIRGIDMEQQEIFINTPLPISIMQHVNCLAGCIPVPESLIQLCQDVPYVGGKAKLPTSREPRKGYFRMKYKNKPTKS